VLAFARALDLARRAQKVRRAPIEAVVQELLHHRGRATKLAVADLSLATRRATRRWARWGRGLDTCLIRSLVLGTLIADRGRVVLTVGFRPGDHALVPEGHAWLTLDGHQLGPDVEVAMADMARLADYPFTIDVSSGAAVDRAE
jgi:hypothetical protein